MKTKENIICRIMGHKFPSGYSKDVPYLKIKNIISDGIGRKHAFLYACCDRCGKDYHVAYTHLAE